MRTVLLLFCILPALLLSTVYASDPPPVKMRLPLRFIANAGQWDASVEYGVFRGTDKAAFTREGLRLYRPMERPSLLPNGEVSLASQGAGARSLECVALDFVSPSPRMTMEGFALSETHTNFYRGSDSSRWRGDVPTYRGLRYRNVWDGIDVEYVEEKGRLRQRVVLREGADPRDVCFRGHDQLTGVGIPTNGTMGDILRSGDVYTLADTSRLWPYRNFFEKRKVIETEFNTFFGGSGYEFQISMDVDDEGTIHIFGCTSSADFPTLNAWQDTHAGGGEWDLDYFVLRLSGDAQRILFSTYLGGSGTEWPRPEPAVGSHLIDATPMKMAVGDNASTHLVCNTESLDFPVTAGIIQPQHPGIRPGWRTASSLVRLSRTGSLDAATWMGGPSCFVGECVRTGPDGNVYVFGLSAHEQWFVTPGTLDDTLETMQSYSDSAMQVAVLVKLSRDYRQVQRGTYLLEAAAHHRMTYRMEIDRHGNAALIFNAPHVALPAVNSWYAPTAGYVLMKIDSSLSRYVFTTGFGGSANLATLALDHADNIIVSGDTPLPQHIALKNPLPQGNAPSFLIKFPPAGGEPVFSTLLPIWLEYQHAPDYIHSLDCGDIFVHGYARTELQELHAPLDTLWDQNAFLVLDAFGQEIRSLGYWHVDERYTFTDSLSYSGGFNRFRFTAQRQFGFVRNQQFTFLSETGIRYADSVSLLRPFRASYAGGDSDLFLFRTRVPGCVLLECSVDMTDTVRIVRRPPVVDPAVMTVTAEVANVDPARSAGAVECVLTLPPGFMLDPPSQSPRQSLGTATIDPAGTTSFTWTVRVDTATISGDNAWIDVVTYYKDAALMSAGAPATSHCEHFIRIEYAEYGELDLACAVTAPDRLSASGNGYTPTPFPVTCDVQNTSQSPVTVARYGLHFGDDIGGIPVPSSAQYQSGTTIAPGATHSVSWQARAERRAEDRSMRVQVIGEDALGDILSFCETDIFVPGLPSPQCESAGTSFVLIDGETGALQPDTIRAAVIMRQVLDTTLLDCTARIDLSGCRYLRLAAGEPVMYGPIRMTPDRADTLVWRLDTLALPAGIARDTIRYFVEAGGGIYQSICTQIVTITTLKQGAECLISAEDSVAVKTVELRDPIYVDYTLTNTGTVPLEIGHYELTCDPSGEVFVLGPPSRRGNALAPGSDTTLYWMLQARVLPAGRWARCRVTAYGQADTAVSVCEHEMWIPGVAAALSCAVQGADTVRFDRAGLRYDPDPLPVTVTISNPFDAEETGIVAEIDLSAAARFALVATEPVQKTLAVVAGGSSADITWQLTAAKAPVGEDGEVIVRFRSNRDSIWRECRTTIHIEAWTEVTSVACATGGHDSLYADRHYERFIPDPLHVSYTVTNTGTVPLTGCAATIVLPPELILMDRDSTQFYTAPEYVNQPGGPVATGTLLPGQACTRWWSVSPSKSLTSMDPRSVQWEWTSNEQGSAEGCDRTIWVVPDNPPDIEVTPFHLRFEAERGRALPDAQWVTLWTGGGLAMPWTLQPVEAWLDVQPGSGAQSEQIAVRPNTTLLDIGWHQSELDLASPMSTQRIAVSYVLRKSTATEAPSTPRTLSLDVWPQPVGTDTRLSIQVRGPVGTHCSLTLHDLLGRRHFSADVEAGRIVDIDLVALRLNAGVYLLRLVSESGSSLGRSIIVSGKE